MGQKLSVQSDSSTVRRIPERRPESRELTEVKQESSRPEHELDLLPFENLVFEGGGAKGIAYAGVLKYLESVGLLDPNGNHRIKRFAGTSAGAITACLLAVGYNADEVKDICDAKEIKKLIYGPGSYIHVITVRLRSIYCLYNNYGLKTPEKITEKIAEHIEKKTQNPDLTFKQLYDKNGNELCIVVTNLSNLSVEYLHPKTCPDFKIKDAVTMSMTIPGYFTTIRHAIGHGRCKDVYVDGGLLCNYPLHCFDGWFLSMKPEDSFMNRVKSIKEIHKLYDKNERFGKKNSKTLGVLIYADKDREWMKYHFDNRPDALKPEFPTPHTKLSLTRKEDEDKKKEGIDQIDKTLKVFRKIASENRIEDDTTINKEEFARIYQDKRLTDKMKKYLFQGKDEQAAFELLDKNKSGKIEYLEITRFIQHCLQNNYIVFNRGEEITSLYLFFRSLASALLANSKLVYINASDTERTIGINTGHVTTLDFILEQGDIDFLIKRGENSARAFMKEYIERRNRNKLLVKNSF